ncbi:hypothetical protein PSTG_05122 [Puccinia striiformis f. sp. tritici PST-78]|uniref:DDE Tnp4 domain-containing protein n=1 Tax=Puccinia striiformis f. sp. tritici PST-78 TaxID=1165861 RepID=A0A0L0VRQ6_9BASI|nr:hypothetical protein PSTG_05122 [Puccinia striiformis f. sp. tritici PST-78]
MRQHSERQKLIRELEMIILWLDGQESDRFVETAIGIRSLPTISQLAFPHSNILQNTFDTLFGDEAEALDILQHILSHQYLEARRPPKSRGEFDLQQLFNMPDYDFRQAARTTKDGFVQVLEKIVCNPVFHRGGRRPQLPIAHQLALTLERLGSNGNGASVGRFSRNLQVGRGTVIKVSRRVIKALVSLGRTYIRWPDAQRRAEISEVLRKEGFEGCVGFVDGTTIPLFQRPGFDGKTFFDHKKRYSLNTQIVCDCDKYITSFLTGWPGSCGNSKVYKRMQRNILMKIWVATRRLTSTVIPSYKSPASNSTINTEFNYCVAKARVRNEHTIGILKARWSSLREMRLHLYIRRHMREVVSWLYSCVVLHNMLAQLGDQWQELESEDQYLGGLDSTPDEPAGASEVAFRDRVKNACVAYNYEKGVLPL